LINLIAGLERPDRGVIDINGTTLFDSSRTFNVPVHRRRIGVVFQEHRLFPHMTVKRNLLYGSRLRQETDGAGDFDRIVEMLELGGLLDRRIGRLSGGECQRVALGRALCCRPGLLLFDEPLASLDRRLKQQIIPFLRRVRDASALPMFYVSHDIAEILQLTDRLVVLERGALVGQGPYADLVHDSSVLDVVHDRGMLNILKARVVEHRPADGLSVLRVGTQIEPRVPWTVPACSAAPGTDVMISVQPWDVAFSTEVLGSVSIQNQIPGVVIRCTVHQSRAVVEVDIGAPLIVEVSRRSVDALNLQPGRPIVCLIKSNAVRHLGPA